MIFQSQRSINYATWFLNNYSTFLNKIINTQKSQFQIK
jgi:hypothetical protein